MKALVIGAGVVGVTTAYYLARSGHQVTVVEKESDVATLASAGNAGLIAPGHSFGWASPSAIRTSGWQVPWRTIRGAAETVTPRGSLN